MRQLVMVLLMVGAHLALASLVDPVPGAPDLAFLNLLAPVAIGLGSKLLSSGGGGGDSGVTNRYMAALDPQRRRADKAEDYYLTEAMAFDPREALEEYGQAAYGDFKRNLDLDIEGLRGQAVGAGRLNTGFYDLDQGELVSDLANRYQRAISSRALDAAGMNLRRIEGIGQYGQGARNTYLDLLAGGMDRETAERNARRNMWSNIIGSGLGAVATYYGSRD